MAKKKLKDISKQHIPFVAQYKNLGEQYIISANVHLDETTPHMHIVFLPVIHKQDSKSGKLIHKLACSEFWQGKNSYQKLQDSFYKYITERGFNLERGKTTNIEHLSTEKFKQITEYNNIKHELNSVPIKNLETQDTSLILLQNKQLISYNKKLKDSLLKSLKAIDEVSKLREENNVLRNQNQKLSEKNKKLTNYIDNTFEVIKYLFNFPIDSLKRIINNFIKTKNKEMQ